jgi:hypothetical protein
MCPRSSRPHLPLIDPENIAGRLGSLRQQTHVDDLVGHHHLVLKEGEGKPQLGENSRRWDSAIMAICTIRGSSGRKRSTTVPRYPGNLPLDFPVATRSFLAAVGAGSRRRTRRNPRSAVGRTNTLTEKPMNRVDPWGMIQRRAADLGTRGRVGCHTFRATGITAYFETGGTLENAQAMAAHESRHNETRRSHWR